MRAWILSLAELDAFRQRLKTLPSASVTALPTIQVADGTPAQGSTHQLINAGGRYQPVGLTVNFLPKAAAHSVKLLLNATSTEITDPIATNNIIIKTNFAAICVAVVPNNGGLVLNGAKSDGTNAQSYWLVISPMMIDANGNPIKP